MSECLHAWGFIIVEEEDMRVMPSKISSTKYICRMCGKVVHNIKNE